MPNSQTYPFSAFLISIVKNMISLSFQKKKSHGDNLLSSETILIGNNYLPNHGTFFFISSLSISLSPLSLSPPFSHHLLSWSHHLNCPTLCYVTLTLQDAGNENITFFLNCPVSWLSLSFCGTVWVLYNWDIFSAWDGIWPTYLHLGHLIGLWLS